jgi:hypothetical protein
MYGLPQAGIIAQQLLEERLAKHGYRQSKTTPGLWQPRHPPHQLLPCRRQFWSEVRRRRARATSVQTRCASITNARATGQENAIVDSPSNGTTPAEQYTSRCRDISPRHYFVSNTPPRPRHRTNHTPTPSPTTEPKHNTPRRSTSPLDKAGKKFIQEVCVTLSSSCARGIDGRHPHRPSSALASQQAKPTENTMKLCKLFLDYMASQRRAHPHI